MPQRITTFALPFLALAAFFLPSAGSAQEIASANEAPSFDHTRFDGPPLPGAAEPAAAAPDLVAWRTVDEGEEEARATGRLVFYFFTADWCSPCISMKDKMFSEAWIADLIHEGYVPVEVKDRRVEEGHNSQEVDRVQMRFLVEAFPTLVVARPYSGHAVTEAGLVNEQGLVSFLRNGPREIAKLERGGR